jgi:hypothetical protein
VQKKFVALCNHSKEKLYLKMAEEATEEQPRKRIRLTEPENGQNGTTTIDATTGNGTSEVKDDPMEIVEEDDDDTQKEIKAGITAFVSPDIPGFSGVLKQRYFPIALLMFSANSYWLDTPISWSMRYHLPVKFCIL